MQNRKHSPYIVVESALPRSCLANSLGADLQKTSACITYSIVVWRHRERVSCARSIAIVVRVTYRDTSPIVACNGWYLQSPPSHRSIATLLLLLLYVTVTIVMMHTHLFNEWKPSDCLSRRRWLFTGQLGRRPVSRSMTLYRGCHLMTSKLVSDTHERLFHVDFFKMLLSSASTGAV
jgi:hypothetical protein